MIIRSKAPLRISFAGGGTDVPPYPEERGGAVLSTTINKYAYATLIPREDSTINVQSLDYDIVAKYKVDGILYHDAKTCPNNSNNRYQMPQRLEAALGIPYLVINGDLNDLRLYSDEQSRTNIEAFIEQIAEG